MPNEKYIEVVIASISKLPDGKFALSTKPRFALSEAELLEELKLKHPPAIVDDLISRVKRRYPN